MRYWVFKHGVKDWNKVEMAYKNNYCYCQFEYGFQEQFEMNWKLLKEVKIGDIIILCVAKSDLKFAWGYAIKPRFENSNLNKVKLNCEKVINTNHHNFKYRSDNYNGYIEFEDCRCFYENLEDGKNGWGQRIDVDKWNDYNGNGISYPHTTHNLQYNIIQEIDKKDALKIVRLLKNDTNFQFKKDIMEDYKKLLENNHNLILTGAPGTGKTYLAKQIAAKMIFDEEYTEELEEYENFKNQCQFVQFHPSYDYTDFVEGLRPIKDSDGKIGFERKDGVFKEFCKEALNNLMDSKKDVSELSKETIIKDNLFKFINEIRESLENNNKFPLKGIGRGEVAPIIYIEDIDKDAIINFSVKTEVKNHNIKLKNIIEMYNSFITEKLYDGCKFKDLEKLKYFKGYTTYKYGFLKAFYEKYNSKIEEELKNNTNTVEKVQKKIFVFIIDEINRGEISKIFGELFFALDSGYRGKSGKVKTQYNNLIDEYDEFDDGFFVPENVYIIGTMNDIDRSVESMDFAMRRRFAFIEIKAKNTQENILKSLDKNIKQEAINRMDNLNNAIYNEKEKQSICELSSSYHIGASYFLKLKNYYDGGNIEEAFKSLWDNHLKGLLFEYLRGMPDAKSKLDDELKKAYDNDKVSDNNATQDSSEAEDSNTNSNDTKQNDSADN